MQKWCHYIFQACSFHSDLSLYFCHFLIFTITNSPVDCTRQFVLTGADSKLKTKPTSCQEDTCVITEYLGAFPIFLLDCISGRGWMEKDLQWAEILAVVRGSGSSLSENNWMIFDRSCCIIGLWNWQNSRLAPWKLFIQKFGWMFSHRFWQFFRFLILSLENASVFK